MTNLCHVCAAPLGNPLYQSNDGQSLTSLSRLLAVPTTVYACKRCAHLQSPVLDDVAAYYEADYDILVASAEEDQVYETREGVPVYRTAHQLATMIAKLGLDGPVDLLDYGCAKSATLRELCKVRAAVTPHLYDVSDRYVPFWDKFVKPDNWAIHTLKPEWTGRFDVVTSFFSLEHIPNPETVMSKIARLLKPGGLFYCIVPDVLGNIADFIVVDHCNHFTKASIAQLVAQSGLKLCDIDDQAHRGALVIVASRPEALDTRTADLQENQLAATHAQLTHIAGYWRDAAARVRAFEDSRPPRERLAIYGAGFYGAFIAAKLGRPARVACHLDQNPYLQGTTFNGRPVLAPADLPVDVSTLLVGLNPRHARNIIADVPELRDRITDCFYL